MVTVIMLLLTSNMLHFCLLTGFTYGLIYKILIGPSVETVGGLCIQYFHMLLSGNSYCPETAPHHHLYLHI